MRFNTNDFFNANFLLGGKKDRQLMPSATRSRVLFHLIYLFVKSIKETNCTFYHFFHTCKKASYDLGLVEIKLK